jgi:hypothetical protein
MLYLHFLSELGSLISRAIETARWCSIKCRVQNVLAATIDRGGSGALLPARPLRRQFH